MQTMQTMQMHVKVLGILYLAVSSLFLGIAVLILLVLGGTAGIVGATADPQEAAIAIPILGLAGSTVAMFLGFFSLPGLVTGFGLLTFKPWARVLGIVLSALNLINVGIGTLLGAYGLWVLLNKDAEGLFEGGPIVSSTSL
jgi:hypothetical protein